MLRVSKHYRSTLTIDGEPCRFVIRKLSMEEFTAFAHEFERLGKVHNAEQLDLRPRDGEEQLTEQQIVAKRYAALSVDKKARFDADDRAEADRGNQFAKDAIEAYITAEPGQIYDEDENREITAGEDLVRHFGSRPDILRDLVAEIFLSNRLSDTDKKKLSLLRASLRSSADRAATRGRTPDSTAESAAGETSASIEGASEVPASDPSGSTGP